MIEIETQRLRLILTDDELLEKAKTARELGPELTVGVPKSWRTCRTVGHIDSFKGKEWPEGVGLWLVVKKDRRPVVVGAVGCALEDKDTVSLAFETMPEYEGMNYATDAAREVVAWLLQRDYVGKVTAFSHPESPASARVLEKLGFEQEGLGPQGIRNRYILTSLIQPED